MTDSRQKTRSNARRLAMEAAQELLDAQADIGSVLQGSPNDPGILEDLFLSLLGPVTSLADAVDILIRTGRHNHGENGKDKVGAG